MSANVDDEWLRPIDPIIDSDAPEQIAHELGRRHAHYLREAQRLVLEGLAPDEAGLSSGIRDETARYLSSQPWLAHPGLEPSVGAAESAALAALHAIASSAPPPPAAPAAAPPVRRLTLQPSATIVGTMAVRKRKVGGGLELSWDPAPNVSEWRVRVSVRHDPRQEYVEGELLSLPSGSTSFAVGLDDDPRKIQLYGHARDGRVVRRATISALTNGNSGAQFKRLATAS